MDLLHLFAAIYIAYLASRHMGFKGLLSQVIVFVIVWMFLPNLFHEAQAQLAVAEFPSSLSVQLWQLGAIAGLVAVVVGYLRFRRQRASFTHKPDTSIKQRLDR